MLTLKLIFNGHEHLLFIRVDLIHVTQKNLAIATYLYVI